MLTRDPLAAVPLARYRLALERRDRAPLPAFAGSALRGALGHALRRRFCPQSGCDERRHAAGCVYARLFETPPPPESERLRRYPAAPHPFVFAPLGAPADGAWAALELTLIGEANAELPAFVTALADALDRGLGGARARLRIAGLNRIDGDAAEELPLPPEPQAARPLAPRAAPGRLVLTTVTPLRLVHRERLVPPGGFTFAALVSPLLRRVSSLAYFHAGAELDADFRGLVAGADVVAVECALAWRDLERYSSRQGRAMKMGGLTGRIALGGDLGPYWPYLRLGEAIHVGKMTSMGLGRYRLEAP